MNELQIFNSDVFGNIRTTEIDGKPYFVATDIATALGYTNPRKAVNDHCKGVTKRDTPTSSGVQSMSYINEGDLYRLIMKSKLPSAEKFESWVMDEVLPTIRRHGMYATEELIANPDLAIQAFTALKAERAKNAELESTVQQMDKVITELTPKADYADRILSSNDCMTVTQIAQDYGLSAVSFNRILSRAGIQRKVGEQWILYAEYQGKGYVQNKTYDYEKSNGTTGTKLSTVWTQKGRLFLYNRLKEIGVYPMMEKEERRQYEGL